MSVWEVTLPVSGVARLEVEADSEAAAIEKALEVVTMDHLEEWEALEQVNQGNVCYALQPWEAEAVEVEQ